MRTYDRPPRKQPEGGEVAPGLPFSRGLHWREIVKEIEDSGALGKWASPQVLQKQPKIQSLYQIVTSRSHHALRELADEGYDIRAATTNNVVVNGVRQGDLLLFVTKKEGS